MITELSTTTLLRFTTAGSVDGGKYTLVGRLLHDSKSALADQREAVCSAPRPPGARMARTWRC
jgi:sulfate adenylyltransferase subunit 1